MKEKSQRFLAGLLAVCMLLSVVPLHTFAEENAGDGKESTVVSNGTSHDDAGGITEDSATDPEDVSKTDVGSKDGEDAKEGEDSPNGEDAELRKKEEEKEPESEAEGEKDNPKVRELFDSDSGVKVSGTVPENAVLTVRILENETPPEEGEQWVCYEISLGKDVQPLGTVKVELPVPENFKGTLSVWYLDGDEAVQMPGEQVGQTYVFETDHFSRYGLRNLEPKPESSENVPVPYAEGLNCTYSLAWVNGYSSDVVDYHYNEDRSRLIFHPKTNELKTATMEFKLNVAGSSEQSLPAGSVSFKVPAGIFKNHQGTINAGVNPQISWQIPKAPATSTTSDFHYTLDPDGENYTVTNFNALPGGMSFSVEISYQFRPSVVPGGNTEDMVKMFGKEGAVYGGDYFQNTFQVALMIDENLDGKPEKEDSLSLSTEVHTRFVPVGTNKYIATDQNKPIIGSPSCTPLPTM